MAAVLLDTLLLQMPFVDAIQVDGGSEFKAPVERLEELIVRHARNRASALLWFHIAAQRSMVMWTEPSAPVQRTSVR